MTLLRADAPRIAAALLAVALVGTSCASSGAGSGAPDSGTTTLGLHSPKGTYRNDDGADGKALDIVPAGENGLVTAADLSAYSARGVRPPNSIDQVTPYNDLIYGASDLTDGDLHDYYLDESFGIRPSDLTRTEHPDPKVPVVVYRDRHDIPHVYGATLGAMAYGAGYVGAEDRLFLMDVLRHYGEGRLMSFVGPSCGYEAMDDSARMTKGYTTADLRAQLDAMPKRFGAPGAELVSMIDSYVAGINRYITLADHQPFIFLLFLGAT